LSSTAIDVGLWTILDGDSTFNSLFPFVFALSYLFAFYPIHTHSSLFRVLAKYLFQGNQHCLETCKCREIIRENSCQEKLFTVLFSSKVVAQWST